MGGKPMHEVKLANQDQNLYAGIGGDFSMANVVVATAEAAEAKQESKPKEGKRAISKDAEVDAKARKEIKENAKQEIDREGKGPDAKAAKAVKLSQATLAKYFPPEVALPQDPEIISVASDLCEVGGTMTVEELPRPILFKYYLRLKNLALEKDIENLEFLRRFETTLSTKHHIEVEGLAEADEQARKLEKGWRKEVREGRASEEDAEKAIEEDILPEQAIPEKELIDPIIGKPAEIKTVGQLQRFADNVRDQVEVAAQNVGSLTTQQLKEQYLAFQRLQARIASKGGFGEREKVGVYGQPYVQLLLQEFGKRGDVTQEDIRDLFLESTRRAAERNTPVRSVGAAALTVEPTWDEPLRLEMDAMNAALIDLPENDYSGQLKELTEAKKLIAKLPAAAVTDPQKAAAMTEITNRINELRPQERIQQEEQRREMSRRHRDEVREEPLRPGDISILTEYTNTEVLPIADEIRAKIRTGEADKDFLKQKVEELSRLSAGFENRGTEEGIAASKEADKLLFEAIKLKDLISSRGREERLKDVQTWSSYGEIRLLPPEKLELVELALKDPKRNPEAYKELEQKFNQLFARADARSKDDWREALGTAGSIEVDDFINALTAAGSGRMTYREDYLGQEQRERINEVVRRLAEEAKLREYLHNVSFYVNQSVPTEKLAEIITGFQAEQADLAYNITGVPVASHFYEQAMLKVMAKNGGWLPYEAMVSIDGKYSEVEQTVYDDMQKARQLKILPETMADWEVGRAISVARGMGIVTGRFFELVAASGIPKGNPLVSWWANKVVKGIAVFKQITRYDVGKKRNAMLMYRLEGGSPVWRINELADIKKQSMAELLDRFVNDNEHDRYMDMVNPFRIGSIFTQTGWRYTDEKVNHAGAIAHLTDEDPQNTIIGLGMWIERERKNLGSKEAVGKEPEKVFKGIRGYERTVQTKGEKADYIIRKNMEMAAKITPLKFFYNLTGLRQRVLRGSDNPTDVNPELAQMYRGKQCIQEFKDKPGQILIKSEQFQKDLDALALVQERLQRKRIDAYKEYLDKRKDYEDRIKAGDQLSEEDKPKPPNLLTPEFTTLDFSGLDPVQAGNAARLAGLIHQEFFREAPGKKSHYERMMNNLTNKGWKVPFVFGVDDLPFDLYSFTATGHDTFGRRWGDINSVANAASGYEKLIRSMATFKDKDTDRAQETLIKTLDEVYRVLVGHDEGVTMDVMERTLEGIIKFYKKDFVDRLPAGLGLLNSFIGGKASYAQLAFGREQMAWDELDVDMFIRKAFGAGLIDEKQAENLRSRTGAKRWHIGLAILRTTGPLFFLAFLYFMLQQVGGDTLKK